MRKRLNKKLLGWTLAGLLLAGAAIHTLHAFQVRVNAGALLRQATRAADRGDHARAVTYFNHYLAYAPNDVEALVRYSRALESLPPTPTSRRQTLRVLEQALGLEPARHALRWRAVHLASGLGRYAEAARHLGVLARAFPKRADVEHQLGWCQEALKEYERSEASFRRAIRKDPAQLESYVLLAELLESRLDRPEEPAGIMDEMIQANPRSARARLLRARYQRAHAAFEEAAEDTRKALELAPGDAEVLLAVVEEAQRREETTQARETLQRGLKLHPKDGRFYRALAALEARVGRRPEAIACLSSGVKALPEDWTLVSLLADLLVDDGRVAEARKLSLRLRKEARAATVADYLEARCLMQGGGWAEACQLLEGVRGQRGAAGWGVQVEISLGQCYGQLGEVEASLVAYRRAVALEPALPLARLGLGAALLAVGNVEEAVRELRAVAGATASPPEVWPVLARALLARNLRLPEGEREWIALDQALNRAEKAAPGAVQVAILRAEVAFVRGATAEAQALLEKVQAAKPKEILVRTALADLARRQGQPEQARALLERARREMGDSLELRLAQVRDAVGRDVEETRRTLQALARVPQEGLGKAEQLRLRRALAEALARAGEWSGAQRLWRELAAARPGDLQSRVALLDLALQAGDDAGARKAVADLRRLEGTEGALWRAGEAARRLTLARRGERSGLAEARKLLGEAKAVRRDWTRLALLEAIADELENKLASATSHYLRALELGERDPAVVARAARLLYERRRYPEADQAIRILEAYGPLERDLARLAADIATAQPGGGERALILARQAVRPDSRDYRDHLWLARIQAAARKDAEAETTLREAVRVSGTIPDVWVALVAHLVHTGQTARAEEALREAARCLPADRADLGLARCEEALGRPERAEARYQRALAARPADFIALRLLAGFYRRNDEPAKAEAPLRKLIEPVTRALEEYVVQARRELAVDLAARGGPGAVAEALALLARNKQVRGPSVADDVVRAFVLATRPERRHEAVALLERLGEPQELSAEEQFLLGRAYEAVEDETRARDVLLNLLAAHGENAQLLAHRTRTLLRQGELAEAGLYLARLERLEPSSPRTRGLRESLRKAEAATPQ
jgi:tetratricopeptide (TPR) repeat protein